jgi:arylsulfatase A-like enzyme
MGFNDFLGSSDMDSIWQYLKTREGHAIQSTRTYTEPVCAPSRSSLIAGRFRTYLNDGPGWGAISKEQERTLPQSLGEMGYTSYAIGKWHIGAETFRYSPAGRGFARYYGNMGNGDHGLSRGNCEDAGSYDMHYIETQQFEKTGAPPTPDKPYHYFPRTSLGDFKVDLFDAKAAEFIDDHWDKYCKDNANQECESKLFLYYAHYALHGPLELTGEYAVRCTEAAFPNYNRRALCGMIASLDSSLQKLESKLSSRFPQENYLILVTSDNGGPVWRWTAGGNNYPLRGNKGENWEGGLRSRAFLFGKHPELESNEIMKGSIYEKPIHLVDWHATFLQLGQKPTTSLEVSGHSVWHAILHNADSPRSEWLSTERGDTYWWQDGDKLYKIIKPGSGNQDKKTRGYRWPVRNIPNDDYMQQHAWTWTESFPVSAPLKPFWDDVSDTDWANIRWITPDATRSTGEFSGTFVNAEFDTEANGVYDTGKKGKDSTAWMLFDLSEDPNEIENLAGTESEKLNTMKVRFEALKTQESKSDGYVTVGGSENLNSRKDVSDEIKAFAKESIGDWDICPYYDGRTTLRYYPSFEATYWWSSAHDLSLFPDSAHTEMMADISSACSSAADRPCLSPLV